MPSSSAPWRRWGGCRPPDPPRPDRARHVPALRRLAARLNATFGPSKGSNFFGQCRAHYELSVKYDVEWKLVAKNSLQLTSLGGVTCGARCDAATPMRKVLVDPGGNYSLLPMWGLPSQREGLS